MTDQGPKPEPGLGKVTIDLNFMRLPGPPIPGLPPLNHETTLRWLCGSNPSELEDILAREAELPNVFAAPAEERILSRLAYPLRNAKGSYMLGNYLGTIALCGMVAEMVAILLWELADVDISGQPMTAKAEEQLLGRRFEKLGQERRVKVLTGCGFLTDEAKRHFDTIRTTRSGHLHLWSKAAESLPDDARKCFTAATALVTFGLGLNIEQNKVVLRPQLLKYLQERGAYEPQVEERGSASGGEVAP